MAISQRLHQNGGSGMLYHLLRSKPGRTWRERLRSFRKKLLLVLESAFVAGVLTGLWWLIFWRNGLRFSAASEVRISTAILAELALLGFIAAVTVDSVVKRSAEMSRYVRAGDERGFMTLRDIRVPVRMHMILGALSSGMMAFFSVFSYESATEGLLTIFVLAFSLVFYFSVTMELQDPRRSTWFRTTAPDEWLAQNANEFFGQGEEEQQTDAA